ncbi:hypothetical protein ACFLXU_06285 [Chloroflexota bacterium]
MDKYNVEQLCAAIKSGASACLSKDLDPEELLYTLRGVVQGESPISQSLLEPDIASWILNEFEAFSKINHEVNEVLAMLTPVEVNVLNQIKDGNLPVDVAEDKVLKYLGVILGKLVSNDRTLEAINSVRGNLNNGISIKSRNKLSDETSGEYVTREEFESLTTIKIARDDTRQEVKESEIDEHEIREDQTTAVENQIKEGGKDSPEEEVTAKAKVLGSTLEQNFKIDTEPESEEHANSTETNKPKKAIEEDILYFVEQRNLLNSRLNKLMQSCSLQEYKTDPAAENEEQNNNHDLLVTENEENVITNNKSHDEDTFVNEDAGSAFKSSVEASEVEDGAAEEKTELDSEEIRHTRQSDIKIKPGIEEIINLAREAERLMTTQTVNQDIEIARKILEIEIAARKQAL